MVGDGAMQMLGNNGLLTIARYWKEWADPRLVILVLNNHDLNQVTWEMRVMEGNPKFEASQEIIDFPYARHAEVLGLRGLRVDDPGAARRRRGTWRFAADRPVVLEVVTDPDVPPLPPHITLEQAKKYTMALLKGDPDERGIIHQSFTEMVAKLLPHRQPRRR